MTGRYALSALALGIYLVRATLEGFAPFEQKVTAAAAAVVVNASLQVAALTDTLTVDARPTASR